MKTYKQFINEMNQSNSEFNTNILGLSCIYSTELELLENSISSKDSEIFKYKNYYYYLTSHANHRNFDEDFMQVLIGIIEIYTYKSKSIEECRKVIEDFIDNNSNLSDQWYAIKDQYTKILNKFTETTSYIEYAYFLDNINIDQDNYNSKLFKIYCNKKPYKDFYNWSWKSVDDGTMFRFKLDEKNHEQFIKDLPSMKIETIHRNALEKLFIEKYNAQDIKDNRFE